MALSKSVDARKRYKGKPPDFAYLATKYPDFKQQVQINLHGGVSLNFKDPEAVRALTCTLLKGLIGHQNSDKSTLRRGIDIGAGESCIYPLLGTTLNGWYFLATEVNDMCFNYAKKNMEQNNLSDPIKAVKVPQKTLLMGTLKEESQIIYDFCMCNPPFFANQLEAKGVNSQNPRRPTPSSVNTGGITEIMAEGGELEFVKRIIHDSLQLEKRLRWYSCVLGKKCSLASLKEELHIQRVPNVTSTELCQGRTMRWALAWSFYDDVTVPSPPSKQRKLGRPRKPITFIVLGSVMKELALQASSLGPEPVEGIVVVQHKQVPCGKEEMSLFLTAIENSWIHLRRKKRGRVRQLREGPLAPKDVVEILEEETSPPESGRSQDVAQGPQESALGGPAPPEGESATVGGHGPSQDSLSQEENPEPTEDERSEEKGDMEVLEGCKGSSNGAQDHKAPEPFSRNHLQGVAGHYLFKCLINVKKEVDDALVETHWVEGQNRDLMNQLRTYIHNQIFRLVAS
uniref:U6 small nuclear RNA (adenine-(43)-N(6))-methyltransferase n=1 Tax=Capra hircus TaxID=9925 RepID=A0A452FW96_CAPHI